MATYSLGCTDAGGNPLSDDLPMGPERNRVFDPKADTRFDQTYDSPNKLKMHVNRHELTYLCYGDQHELTSDDEQQLKKTLKKAGLGDAIKVAIKCKMVGHVESMHLVTVELTQRNTIVIQVAAGIRNGAVTACRNFGKGPTGDSKYNRGSSPGQDSAEVRALFGTVDIGAQAAATIVQSHQHINTVIFMTSSDDLIDAATNIWQYSANGFPELPAGLTTEDYFMLHGNLKRLEETRDGIKVAFWKVDKAFLANATFDVVCRLDEHEGVPAEVTQRRNRGGCACADCIQRDQGCELEFAKSGSAVVHTCPCESHKAVLARYGHLKKGDTFEITNIAGSEYRVTMEVDGTPALA